MFFLQLMENDDFIDAVQELGPEGPLQIRQDPVLNALIGLLRRRRPKTDGSFPLEVLGTHVGGHDNHGIAKIYLPPLGIGEAAVLQDLQENIEDLRMGLFNFVEEDYRIGLLPHLFRQLPRLFIAHIAGRGANQAGDGVSFHVLGHVEADHGLLIAEELLRQGPGQFRFPDPRGTQEDKGTDGSFRVLEARPGPAHRLGHRLHRFLLADNPPVQAFLQF